MTSDKLNVVAKIRVLPTDVSVDLNAINDKISTIVSDYGKVYKTEVVPIAFGLNSVVMTMLLKDSEGGIEKIEEGVKNLDGVGGFEVIDLNRL